MKTLKKPGLPARTREIVGVTISFLSSEKIRNISSGEITDHHTMDLKKRRPVPGGLHCERIFGPVQRGVCGCGVYHRNWHKGKTKRCHICQVDLVDPIERRRRSGHIELAAPVVHPWYRKHIARLLGIPLTKVVSLIQCDSYMVEHPGLSEWSAGETIPTPAYLAYEKSSKDSFRALTGAKLIRNLLSNLDLEKLYTQLRRKEKRSAAANARLLLVRNLLFSGTDPKGMILNTLLVLPPDLRPALFFDDGSSADSDLNTLYGKIIIQNTRLKKLYDNNAPEVLINLARKLLQRAVDALFDNEKKVGATARNGKRVLKSLSASIEKKTGRLRRNLLGKRVDFSGRSVIAVGPELKLHQCGIPIDMALDICRPFVYRRLLKWGYAPSLQFARKLLERRSSRSLDALEEELAERTVLLNRAPSLHRMSVQAFEPVMIKERVLRLHPLVCSAFNADFDGDQMGVHLPVTVEAQVETKILMISAGNLFAPASGKLVPQPSQDIVLGIYYLTMEYEGEPGEGKQFSDLMDLERACDLDVVSLHARVSVRCEGELVETTAGRAVFHQLFEGALPYSATNKTIRKKDIAKTVEAFYQARGPQATVRLLDRIKATGFKYATLSGTSICVDDMVIPEEKWAIISAAREKLQENEQIFLDGLMTKTERSNKLISIWQKATEEIGEKMAASLGSRNSIFLMADSGARGSKEQMRQMGAMRGLMAKPTGEIVEIPITSNLREGLTYQEYLLACHGARKGRADGALKTANAGYFTRKLVDAAHDVVINGEDCKASMGQQISALYESGEVMIPLEERIKGRVLARAVREGNNVIARCGELVTPEIAAAIKEAGIGAVDVRSPLYCEMRKGICATCYGLDLSSRRLPVIGDAVGIIAAQSIGEPGTQLTLRTFHSGGSASGADAVSFLEAKRDGTVNYHDIKTVVDRKGRHIVVSRGGRISVKGLRGTPEEVAIPCGAVVLASDGATVTKGDMMAEWDPYNTFIVSAVEGNAELSNVVEGLTMRSDLDPETGITTRFISAILADMVPAIQVGSQAYPLPLGAVIVISQGQEIGPGEVLAKIPKHTAKSVDITGGLNRVIEILEARKPKERAILAEVDGEVRVHLPEKGHVPVEVLMPSGEIRRCLGRSEALIVFDGDRIKAGETIFDGLIDLRDIVRVLGRGAAARYAIDEIQKVYRGQGVEIDDKHFEIIMAKMLSKAEITDPGDSECVEGELVAVYDFVHDKKGFRDAKARQIILSLTKTAELSESWLSAASFQGTTAVLADAALARRTDPLTGTKENILVGNLVPVGTGHPRYRDTYVVPPPSRKAQQRREAIRNFSDLFSEKD